MTSYDTVVIGAGIGGLTSASLLSRVRTERVLLVEQHFKLGGFTHTFRRRQYEWDIGLHYVGQMHNSAFVRKLMDFLTGGRLRWHKMADPFERYVFPELTFFQRCGLPAFQSDLQEAFPTDAKGIDAYFVGLRRVQRWGYCWMAQKMLPPSIAWIPRLFGLRGAPLACLTAQQFLDSLTKNSQLSAVLSAQCGNYGLLPDQASLFIHAMVVMHYLDGGYYPEGGSRAVGTEIARSLHKHNVEIRLNHEVREILVKNRRVAGILLRDKRTKDGGWSMIKCGKVISTAGARETYLHLLSPRVEIPFRDELRQLPLGTSMVAVYAGLKCSPEKFGFGSDNVWIFDSQDLELIRRDLDQLADGRVRICFATFPTLKAGLGTRSRHTAELLTPALYETFAPWANQTWLNRDQEYQDLKVKIGQHLIEFVDHRFPGFKNAVDCFEVSTPLSFQHFSNHDRGAVYGLPATVERLQAAWLGPKTPIKGLYLGGADTFCHGVSGAMFGGFGAVMAAQGVRGALEIVRSVLGRN